MATITYAFAPILGETTLNQNTAGVQSLPATGDLAGGGYISAWDNQGDISGRIFENSGAPRTAEFTINTTLTGIQTDPKVVGLVGGRAVAVWTDFGGAEAEIRAQMINTDGTLFGPEIFISEQPGPATTAGDQTRADVIGLSDGGWVVVWQDNDGATHDVLAQIYNADGSFRPAAGTADGRIRIDPGAIDVTQPTVAPITGGFAIVWSQQVAVGDLDMFGQRFNLAGSLVGTSFLVDSGGTVSSQSDAIGLPTGGFALAYLDNNFGELDITLSTWDASANLLDFVTANGPGGFVGGGDGNQTDPSLDVLSNGFIQVSWTNDFGIDSLDTVDTAVWSGPVPLSLILNAPGGTLSSQNQSALAGLPLGKFSLAGHDTGNTSDITGVIQELVRTTTGDNTPEILSGDSLRDIMFGLGGNDTLTGGAGNDTLDGGADIDTAVYSGTLAQFRVNQLLNGDLQVVDLRPGAPDGIDTVRHVENFAFTDGTFAASDAITEIFRAQRFFDSATGDHFYTLSAAEADQIRATLPTFHDEGSPWGTPDGPNTIDVFRFFDTVTGTHFLTSSTVERDFIIAHTPTLHFEGVAFEAYTAPEPGTLTLERFFNTITGLHHLSASAAETANINGGGAGPGWVDEGAGFIVHT